MINEKKKKLFVTNELREIECRRIFKIKVFMALFLSYILPLPGTFMIRGIWRF
jgi:hypothetical protein